MTAKKQIKLSICLTIWILSLINGYARSDTLLIRAHFSNRPIEEVLTHLADTYQLSFSYEPSAVQGITITAHIDERPLDEAAALIFGASGLDFMIMSDRKIMLRPKPKSPDEILLKKETEIVLPKILELKGYIRDAENGMPLPYANIILSGTKYGIISENNGRFTFRIPYTIDDIPLKITYVGYTSKRLIIPNNKNKHQIVVDLQAKHSSLPTIEIEEKSSLLKQNAGISQFVLSPKQLSSLPSLGQHDLMHAIKYLPGVNGQDESSARFSVRGGTEDENLIIMDDITLYHVDHFWGVFSAFNPEAIEQIKVYKSDFPMRYGGKTSSVIELTGKTISNEGIHGGIGLNLLSSDIWLDVPIGNKLSVSVAARRSYTDIIQSGTYTELFDFAKNNAQVGILSGADNQAINTLGSQNPDYYFQDLHAKASFTPSDNERLSFSFFEGKDNLDLSSTRNFRFNRERVVVNVEENTKNITEWINRGASLQWEKRWTPRIKTHLSGSFSNYDRTFDLAVQAIRSVPNNSKTKLLASVDEVNIIEDFSLRGNIDWQIHKHHAFLIGGEYNESSIKYLFETHRGKHADRQNEGKIISAYGEYRFRPNEKFEFDFGLRDNHFGITDKHYLSPRASLSFSPIKHLQLKAAWGRYYQYVKEVGVHQNGNVRDIWVVANGEQLPITKAIHYVGGFSIKYPDFLIDVEAYKKDLDGLATLIALNPRVDSLDDRPMPEQVKYKFFQGVGRAVGIDVLIQKNTGIYTGWVAYSLGRVTHQFDKINRGEPFPAEEDQRHQLKFVNMLRLDKWDLSMSWIYGSGRAYTDMETQLRDQEAGRTIRFQNARLPAYQRIDIGATYNFEVKTFKGEIGASIFNLFDRQNVKYRQYLYAIQASQNPTSRPVSRVIGDDAELLGFTPNVFFNIRF